MFIGHPDRARYTGGLVLRGFFPSGYLGSVSDLMTLNPAMAYLTPVMVPWVLAITRCSGE